MCVDSNLNLGGIWLSHYTGLLNLPRTLYEILCLGFAYLAESRFLVLVASEGMVQLI